MTNKEAIKQIECAIITGNINDVQCGALKKAIEALKKPVVYGHWEIAIGYDVNRKVKCSECNRMNFEPSNFCPNCGAKMDDTIS